MIIEVISAKKPRRYQGGKSITLDVLFNHLPEPVPFTAVADDSAEYGRELYVRALFGEFGEISELEPPLGIQPDAIARKQLNDLMAQAERRIAPLRDAVDLGIATELESERLLAEQTYRVALMRVPEGAGWPDDIVWPEIPQ